MKKQIGLIILMLSMAASAEIGLQFNIHGEFIPPDMILQARGIDSYEKGFIDSSVANFKKSAKFGNERSKYLLAMLSFQEKNWPEGYAWLKLIKGNVENKDGLMEKVTNMLTQEEFLTSERILQGLKKEYNENESLRRRDKWERSLQGVGTRIRGIDAMTMRDVTMAFGDFSKPVYSYDIKQKVRDYVFEYQPRGIVEMGVIEEIESKKGE